ncbi:hypothetical protein PAERUG_P54_1_London_24_VIM_2_04_13_02982 [Pseudomonas aeruginosa]|nr:hypothetical protein PAERUG_P54_1_London_24_VIM_2_04_13_02982 [Pseudomonas aeruginosa]
MRHLSGRQCLIGLLQVFQQYPPGHPIHHQVVYDQQQSLAAVRQGRKQRPQQGAMTQIQAALAGLDHLLQFFRSIQRTFPQQLFARLLRQELRLPAPFARHVTQAQGIMLFDQRRQGPLQRLRVERLAGFQQQRLVPVMALGDILLEETLLDRHQWHRAENRPLIDKLPRIEPHSPCQSLYRLVLEQILGSKADSRLARPANQLQRDDRIPAELEEVVGHPDPLQLQHIRPDRCQCALQLRHRRHILLLAVTGVRRR